MVQSIFSAFYRLYISAGKYFSQFHVATHASHTASGVVNQKFSRLHDSEFATVDALAMAYGNCYRGAGVAIGALAVLIILFAVMPSALQLTGVAKYFASVIKIVMMMAMLGVIAVSAHQKYKEYWLYYRRKAEELRYKPLFGQLSAYKATLRAGGIQNESDQAYQALIVNLKQYLGQDPDRCQIMYNNERAKLYHAIEHASERISWVAFLAALMGGVAYLVTGAHWLLFLTVVVPSAVGALHGINYFLRINDLADEHAKMAHRLSEMARKLDNLGPSEPERLLELGEGILASLTTRDAQWQNTASRLGLHIG